MANPSNADDILTRYIQRVSELSQRQQQLPTTPELEALALELGLSETDLKLAQAEAKSCRQRARTYCRVGRWEDAIAEFEGAALVPITSPNILMEWAGAHKGRYKETGNKKHRDQARQLARQCLDLKPDFRAAAIFLNELDAIAKPSPIHFLANARSAGLHAGQALTDKLRPKLKSRPAKAIASIIALAGIASLGYLRVASKTDAPRPFPVLSSPPTETTRPASTFPAGTVQIPATLKPGEGGTSLALETRTSGLTRYSNGSAYYRAQLMLVNNTQQEISKAQGKLEYLDQNGTVIHSQEVKLLETFQPVLRPGDRYPVSISDSASRIPNLSALAAVRLTPNYLDSTPAAENYPAATEGQFTWAVSQPPGAAIAVGIRNQTANSYSSGASNYFKLTAEITNTGSVNLKKLKLEIEVFDDQGQTLNIRPLLVSYGNRPPLLRDETRLVRTTISIPRSPQTYRLRVVEAESL